MAGRQVLDFGVSRVVLAVDDGPFVLDVTTKCWKISGAKVTAGSGGEALDIFSDNRQIEILITDLNMPGWTATNWRNGRRSGRHRPGRSAGGSTG